MVPPEEYFYYLRRSFRSNRVKGYCIGKKRRGKVCLYEEDGEWVVAYIRKGVAEDPKRFPADGIWRACEEIINRLVQDDRHDKVWMDWASPSNWAEKMDEPLRAVPVDPKKLNKE